MLPGNFLAVDTSTTSCSIYLQYNGKEIIYELFGQATHACQFFSWIAEIKKEHPNVFEELDSLGVCLGPGKFNGVRVGVTFIATLMVEYNLPVWTCTSHQLLAARSSNLLQSNRLAIFAKYGHCYVVQKGNWQEIKLLPFEEIDKETITFEIPSMQSLEDHQKISIIDIKTLIKNNEAVLLKDVQEIEILYGADMVN